MDLAALSPQPTGADIPMRGICDLQPALRWEDAFVSGNGLYGILVYGDPLNETVIFNDHRFVYPNADFSQAPDMAAALPQVQDAALAGQFIQAGQLSCNAAQAAGWSGMVWTQAYHPGYLMRLVSPSNGAISNYQRTTTFTTGEIGVQWTDDVGDWVRRSFVSRADNVIVQQLVAPVAGCINVSLHLSASLQGVPEELSFSSWADAGPDDNLFLSLLGSYPLALSHGGYAGVTRVVAVGGTQRIEGDVLYITDASELLLLTMLDRFADAATWQQDALQRQLLLLSSDYATLLQRHCAIHSTIYNRVQLDLHADPSDRVLPTSVLIDKQLSETKQINLALLEKMFDAGRYAFLSASGYYPPRLPGIWQGSWFPAWSGDFTLDANVNLQVAAGNIGAMPEAMQGYFHLILSQICDWQTNAIHIMGTRGILAPSRSDGENGLLFHFRSDYPFQLWTAGADWLLQPLYEYYQVSGDRIFLRESLLPWLLELALFYEDFLTRTDSHGKVIFVPSYSPENSPANTDSPLAINATMDIAAAKHALQTLISICNDLDIEQGAGQGVQRWRALLDKLPPYLINSEGALAEWSWPGLIDNYDHRHISHLYPVWPLQEINPDDTPELFTAARRAVELRSPETGQAHGYLHRALVQARFKDGAAVYQNTLALLSGNYLYRSLMTSHNPNLDIYNTDASCSLPAIVIEMLIDSRPGVLEFLPALPDQLVQGTISGIKGRNQVSILSLRWDLAQQTVQVLVHSEVAQEIILINRRGISAITSDAPLAPSALGAIARVISLQAGVDTNIHVVWN